MIPRRSLHRDKMLVGFVSIWFMNRFSAAKFLPHTDVGRFPSVNLK